MAEERVQRRLAAILAADVVGYSRLMEADEVGTLARLKALRRELFAPKMKEYGGRIFKTTGDGALVEFKSAVDAVNSARDIQQSLALRNQSVPDDQRTELRIGISLGDVIVEGSDLYRNGVNVAARMEGLAEPGGICISGNVQEHVGTSLDVSLEDLGEQTVKNINRPVRCYRVNLEAHPVTDTHALQLPDKPSIAVLPFENLSDDKEQNYFADGMTEDLITDLSKVSGLFVIARNSSFAYKGKQTDLRAVGRELGVRHILEGSVRRAGDRVRINAQLIDTSTGGHLWAERYDGKLSDIFDLQDEIGKRIISALEVQLTETEIERRKPGHVPVLEAYDHFIRGRHMVNEQYFRHSQVSHSAPSGEILRSAQDHFQRATVIDPKFAGGYAGLSWSYSLGVRHGLSDSPEKDKEEALRLANVAIETDDSFAWAHTAQGSILVMLGRHEDAITAARRAVELQPSDGDAHSYLGFQLFWAGLPDQALRSLEEALRLDPQFLGRILGFIGIAKFGLERFEEAAKDLEAAISTGHIIHFTLAFLVASYWKLGRAQDTEDTIARLLDRYPNFTVSGFCDLLPYKYDRDTRRVRDLLRDAGVPV